MKQKKRVAAIITEYWDICHADVIVTKMVEGFMLDGKRYSSSLEVVSMYVDQFPDNDISRELSAKHGIPIYSTIDEALKCGGTDFDLDGIIIIGEHGEYPENEYRQVLYPRRRFFEQCLKVMLEAERIVPVYSDKGFAVIREDVEWMYEQIKRYDIPFMSSSVIPFARQYYDSRPLPNGAPLHKMFGFAYDHLHESPERYTYHTLEMLQSVAENRAYGESGIVGVRSFSGQAAIDKVFSAEWSRMYSSLCGFINMADEQAFPYRLTNPLFFEVDYVDGLQAGILHTDTDMTDFVAAFQAEEDDEPLCREYRLQAGKPYIHFGVLVLEIEKFIHTSRPPFPIERSYLTTGALDAIMRSVYHQSEIKTPYLQVRY